VRPELAAWIDRLRPGARVEEIAGDASSRRFHRVHPPSGPTCVVMDYGAPFAGESDDQRLTRIFLEAGLPVAAILAAGPEVGALLLQDLGPTSLEDALSAGRDPGPLYARAAGLAVRIAVDGTAALARSERAAGPALDAARFRFEMDFFLEHYVAGLCGRPARGLAPRLHALADAAAASSPPVLCHRDFHSRNLLVRPDGSLAMVDLQDARWGPDTYDLASLLRDAYVDLAEDLLERTLEGARTALPGPPDPTGFRSRFDLVATQRMVKALGTFGYQAGALGRGRYLSAIPRTLARLERTEVGDDLRRHGLLALPPGLEKERGRPGA